MWPGDVPSFTCTATISHAFVFGMLNNFAPLFCNRLIYGYSSFARACTRRAAKDVKIIYLWWKPWATTTLSQAHTSLFIVLPTGIFCASISVKLILEAHFAGKLQSNLLQALELIWILLLIKYLHRDRMETFRWYSLVQGIFSGLTKNFCFEFLRIASKAMEN